MKAANLQAPLSPRFLSAQKKELTEFTCSELLRGICSKGKQEQVLVALITFVFSNHPSVFQGFTGEALHSFPSVAALWLHWEEGVHKDLKETPSSNI